MHTCAKPEEGETVVHCALEQSLGCVCFHGWDELRINLKLYLNCCRGLPVDKYTRLQTLIAYWGFGLYWGEPVSYPSS